MTFWKRGWVAKEPCPEIIIKGHAPSVEVYDFTTTDFEQDRETLRLLRAGEPGL